VKRLGEDTAEIADDALIERALPLLPEIGKLLYAAVSRHPEAAGLSLAQIKAMGHLSLHGRQSVGEIAQGLGVSLPSASELVDRLVERGLADRGANPADRRQVLVWLTPEAERFKTEMRALRRAQLRAALDRLEPAERPAFVRSLEALVAALRLEPDPTPNAASFGVKRRPAEEGR
jgi:DNA-binding MarR family transcriptional regulator